MPQCSNSASIALKTISVGVNTRLVQRMITARAAIRYSVIESYSHARCWLVSSMVYACVITTLAVDLGSTAEERRRCRDKVCGARACPSILESRSFAGVLTGSERVGRPALNRSASGDRPHTHLGSVISSSANAACPLPTAASKVVAKMVNLDM